MSVVRPRQYVGMGECSTGASSTTLVHAPPIAVAPEAAVTRPVSNVVGPLPGPLVGQGASVRPFAGASQEVAAAFAEACHMAPLGRVGDSTPPTRCAKLPRKGIALVRVDLVRGGDAPLVQSPLELARCANPNAEPMASTQRCVGTGYWRQLSQRTWLEDCCPLAAGSSPAGLPGSGLPRPSELRWAR